MRKTWLLQVVGLAALSIVLVIGCSENTTQDPRDSFGSPEAGVSLFEAEQVIDGGTTIDIGQDSEATVIIEGPIEAVDQNSMTTEYCITFGDVAGGPGAGTIYHPILESGCAAFAERFAGQDRSTVMVFGFPHDSLSASASGPLALEPGLPGQNVGVSNGTSCGPTETLITWGPIGYPDISSGGEGSFAVLFDNDQSYFGIRMCGGNGGSATVQFFRRDGSLLGAVVLSGVRDNVFAFWRLGGIKDIAGVSIHNDDVGGIGYDDICHDVSECGEGAPDLYLDIKPTSCPNPLNLTSHGVLPVAILGTEGTDVSLVDVSTVRLEGLSPLRHSYEDVTTPVVDGEPCECTTDGADGFMDLTLKFDKDSLVEILGELPTGEVITLTLTGATVDGRQFALTDCMVIRGRPTRMAVQ